jgi:itaconate CoA-transferase
VLARLDAAQIANACVNTMSEVWAHPQLRARQRWAEVGTPSGPVPALLPPGAASARDARMGPVPALGEHTDSILQALGYGAAERARLRSDGVV